jgi:hypothetical protein
MRTVTGVARALSPAAAIALTGAPVPRPGPRAVSARAESGRLGVAPRCAASSSLSGSSGDGSSPRSTAK